MIVTLNLSLTGEGPHLVDALAKMFSVLGNQSVSVAVAPLPIVPSATPVTAPVLPPVASVPAPPLAPETKARLDAMEAKRTETPVADEPEKPRRGRPPGSTKKPVVDDAVPVPRPASGAYGRDESPEWVAARDAAKPRLAVVLAILAAREIPHEKFLSGLWAKYGDGKFSTVPIGNMDALVAEAERGPKDNPLTAADLDEGRQILEQQQAHEAAQAGA